MASAATRKLTVLALAALSAGACDGDPAPAHVTVRDSAGVAIWENDAALWREGEAWTVSATPSLSLGAMEGAGPDVFGQIVDLASVGDGAIAVADAQAGEVRVFSRTGAHLATLGRAGQGPGEFVSLMSVQGLGGDTLAVYDSGLGRLTRFVLSGAVVRERDLGPLEVNGELAFVERVRILSGGGLATRESRDFSGDGERDGVFRDTVHFVIVPPGESRPVLVDALPGVWTLWITFQGQRLFRFQPFTPYPQLAARGDTMYLMSGEHFEIRKATASGLVGIIRRGMAPPPVTQEDRDRFIEAAMAPMPEEQWREARLLLGSMSFPQRLPAYRKLLVDPDGNVWAERYMSPGFPSGPEWDVFTGAGQYLGAVRNPEGLDWFEVGRDYVLGVWEDEFDVPHVRIHALLRIPVPSS